MGSLVQATYGFFDDEVTELKLNNPHPKLDVITKDTLGCCNNFKKIKTLTIIFKSLTNF